MRTKITLCVGMGMLAMWCAVAPASALEVEGGLVVRIGAEALESVSNDWNKPGCLFQCLVTSPEKSSSLRKEIMEAGFYGKVSVAQFDGQHLPYINNLVNLVVAENGFNVPNSELNRVLAPYGVAVVDGKQMTKPYPKEMDEWPQYLHGGVILCG